jgi:hypothetical protein
MIDVREEPLTVLEQDKLVKWLGQGECSTLIKVAEGKMKLEAVKVLPDAVSAATPGKGGYPQKIEAANIHLVAATRYRIFIDVLLQFKAQKTFNSVHLF